MEELIARLAATPGALAQMVAESSDAELDAAPAEAWSARTVLAHFRDDEYLCMRVVLERALAEDTPVVNFIEGEDWEPGRNRTRDRKEWLLADFALQRQATLGILRLLRPEDWERKARRTDGAEFTLAKFIGAWANHDAEHLAQLETALGETLADVRARRARMEDTRHI